MPDQLPQYMDADQLFSLKIPKARMKQISELKVWLVSCDAIYYLSFQISSFSGPCSEKVGHPCDRIYLSF